MSLILCFGIFAQSLIPRESLSNLAEVPLTKLQSYANGHGKTVLLTWQKGRNAVFTVIDHDGEAIWIDKDQRIRIHYPFCSIWTNQKGFYIVDAITKKGYQLNKGATFESVNDWGHILFPSNKRTFIPTRAIPISESVFWLSVIQKMPRGNVYEFYIVDIENQTQQFQYTLPDGSHSHLLVPDKSSFILADQREGGIWRLSQDFTKETTILNPNGPLEFEHRGKFRNQAVIGDFVIGDTHEGAVFLFGHKPLEWTFIKIKPDNTTQFDPFLMIRKEAKRHLVADLDTGDLRWETK